MTKNRKERRREKEERRRGNKWMCVRPSVCVKTNRQNALNTTIHLLTVCALWRRVQRQRCCVSLWSLSVLCALYDITPVSIATRYMESHRKGWGCCVMCCDLQVRVTVSDLCRQGHKVTLYEELSFCSLGNKIDCHRFSSVGVTFSSRRCLIESAHRGKKNRFCLQALSLTRHSSEKILDAQ